MKHIIKYGLLILQDGKFLIARKKGTKLFLIPGGKPEGSESPEECLAREIAEELHCEVMLDSVRFVHSFTDKAANEADTEVTVRLYQGVVVGQPRPSNEIEELRWWRDGDDEEILSATIRNKMLPFFREHGLLG
jgi:8-oxo-dGTP diphosphatase